MWHRVISNKLNIKDIFQIRYNLNNHNNLFIGYGFLKAKTVTVVRTSGLVAGILLDPNVGSGTYNLDNKDDLICTSNDSTNVSFTTDATDRINNITFVTSPASNSAYFTANIEGYKSVMVESIIGTLTFIKDGGTGIAITQNGTYNIQNVTTLRVNMGNAGGVLKFIK